MVHVAVDRTATCINATATATTAAATCVTAGVATLQSTHTHTYTHSHRAPTNYACTCTRAACAHARVPSCRKIHSHRYIKQLCALRRKKCTRRTSCVRSTTPKRVPPIRDARATMQMESVAVGVRAPTPAACKLLNYVRVFDCQRTRRRVFQKRACSWLIFIFRRTSVLCVHMHS